MSLRDLIFSQQSSNVSFDDAYNLPSDFLAPTQVSAQGIYGEESFIGLDDSYPYFEREESGVANSSSHLKQKKTDQKRFSYDNSEYYSNLLYPHDDDDDERYQDDDEESGKEEKLQGKSSKKKSANLQDARRRGSRYFARTPNPCNGGRYYLYSPEFTFDRQIYYYKNNRSQSLQEFLSNQLSFMKFPQLEESFYSFQRKIIQDLLLRSYYGKDIDGFIQVLNVLIEKQRIQLPDIELFLELLRYSSHRIPIIMKFGTNLFSKQYLSRIHYPKHKSLLYSLLDILLQESLVETESSLDELSISRSEGLLQQIKQIIMNCQEFPSMKSVSMLWSLDGIILCHQMVHKVQQLLGQFDMIELVSVEQILLNPFSFSVVSKILSYFEQVRYRRFAHHQQQSKILLREATNCFHFVVKDSEARYWIEFQELYLGFLLGKNELPRALRFLKDLEKRYIVSEESLGENPHNAFDQALLDYKECRFLSLLLKYIFEYELPTTFIQTKKPEIEGLCSKIFKFIFLKSNNVDGNAISIAWYLFHSQEVIKQEEFVEIVQKYLELHPPVHLSCVNNAISQQRAADNNISRGYDHSPYDSSHYLAWNMLALGLGPLPVERRLKNSDPVPKFSDPFAFNRNGNILNQIFVDGNPSNGNGKISQEQPSIVQKDLMERLLLGSMLDSFSTLVLPFRFERILENLEGKQIHSTNEDSSFTIVSDLMEEEIAKLGQKTEQQLGLGTSLLEQFIRRLHQVASREDLSIYSALSETQSQRSQLSGMTLDESDLQDHRTRRGSVDLQSRSIFDDEYRLECIDRFQEDEANHSIIPFSSLLFFTYRQHDSNLLHLLYENSVGVPSSSKNFSDDTVFEDYSIIKIRRRVPQFFEQKPSQIKKEAKRNNYYENQFLLGGRLLELFSFQTLVSAHCMTQDCFFATRTIQLLFQHLDHYSTFLFALDNKMPSSSQQTTERFDEDLVNNSYLETLYIPLLVADKDEEDSEDYDEEDESAQKLLAQRNSVIAKRNQIIRCLLFLHTSGINLRRGLFLAFTWANQNLSMTLPAEQYFLQEGIILEKDDLIFHHQGPGSYYHPHVGNL